MTPAARSWYRSALGELRSPVGLFDLALTAAAVAAALIGGLFRFHTPGHPTWWALPFLFLAYLIAENLRIRFRRGEDTDAWTLSESVLAPMLFYFAAPVVVITAAVAHALLAGARRASPVKGAFNVAQCALAAGVGSLVLSLMTHQDGVNLHTLGALVVAMACVAVVNNTAFTLVLAISSRHSVVSVLKSLSPIILPGWVGGWVVNLLMGLLFVMAAAGDPIAVVLFPVPLVVLFFAYRGYAAARADRQRLTGLRQAAHVLSEPLHPRHAIDDYLREVANCFESQGATLVLLTEAGDYEIHALQPGPEGGVTERIEPSGSDSFESRLAAVPEPRRITAGEDDEMAQALGSAGWRDCICAPLVDEHRQLGVLAVFDQSGLEGTATSDLAVLDALGRETAHTIARGRMFETVVEERRKFAQILGTTSDGIFTLAQDGSVLSWNAACEHITGLAEKDVLGRKDALVRLEARTAAGSRVDFHGWSAGEALPRKILLTHPNGSHRRLSVSSSPAVDFEDQAETLVVVARDITPAD
ncbi:MAG: PAS domain S-box protein, partial [Nocardioidaceae bacterium]